MGSYWDWVRGPFQFEFCCECLSTGWLYRYFELKTDALILSSVTLSLCNLHIYMFLHVLSWILQPREVVWSLRIDEGQNSIFKFRITLLSNVTPQPRYQDLSRSWITREIQTRILCRHLDIHLVLLWSFWHPHRRGVCLEALFCFFPFADR